MSSCRYRSSDGVVKARWWSPAKRSAGNRSEAYDRWSDLRRGRRPAESIKSESVVSLLDLYLDWCSRNRAAATYRLNLGLLQTFCSHVGSQCLASDLRPKHVTAWLDSHEWSDSTKATAVQTLRSAFRWLVREGHLEKSPVADARGPSRKSREVILTADEFASILRNVKSDFATLLEFIWHTGCRPQEAVIIEVQHCEPGLRRVVLPPSLSKGRRHPRVIYLDDRALEILQRELRKRSTGRVFRTARGKPWNRNTVRCRFRSLKKRVGGPQYCAYHLRHSFATNALQRLDPISVATLMGHTDATTLARNYQHLAKLPAVMIEAAKLYPAVE